MGANGYAAPANYDLFHRPRRQEFDGYLVENGQKDAKEVASYVTVPKGGDGAIREIIDKFFIE